jgi:hypothetical protein
VNPSYVSGEKNASIERERGREVEGRSRDRSNRNAMGAAVDKKKERKNERKVKDSTVEIMNDTHKGILLMACAIAI